MPPEVCPEFESSALPTAFVLPNQDFAAESQPGTIGSVLGHTEKLSTGRAGGYRTPVVRTRGGVVLVEIAPSRRSAARALWPPQGRRYGVTPSPIDRDSASLDLEQANLAPAVDGEHVAHAGRAEIEPADAPERVPLEQDRLFAAFDVE